MAAGSVSRLQELSASVLGGPIKKSALEWTKTDNEFKAVSQMRHAFEHRRFCLPGAWPARQDIPLLAGAGFRTPLGRQKVGPRSVLSQARLV